jgi:hypothetical protein
MDSSGSCKNNVMQFGQYDPNRIKGWHTSCQESRNVYGSGSFFALVLGDSIGAYVYIILESMGTSTHLIVGRHLFRKVHALDLRILFAEAMIDAHRQEKLPPKVGTFSALIVHVSEIDERSQFVLVGKYEMVEYVGETREETGA